MRLFSLSTRVANLRRRINDKLTLPDRFKGTVVEKWAQYWRGLASDYTDVVVDVVKGARAKPRKALFIAGTSYGLYKCAQHNPDEEAFMHSLRGWSNQMSMVSNSLHNPVSEEYLRDLEIAINEKKLRTLSLGICTILWKDLYDIEDCTYPAICKYTQVDYTNFWNQIVDVGFWDHYWRLEWKMRNFDVNYL
ncbi:mitochondrial import inner membrane translocase subunit Tim29 [Ceratitis capitata]|uniref:mitochondrial import inner membrane translocase subunit Tim29 n=1 Tax=Ceratitis capitata TaxID=7213 RepID=UPI000329BD4B|nr:mitochondrial import inner membrane translocase subunit Tim29 [Ceratitis capitata]